ncbi:adenylate/guanylate cyclase domain-containing protein [Nocardioides mangrovicus]|nr:adenylate/guanylate cyclase domain-containing protein [Nocardioides mangrovicus]
MRTGRDHPFGSWLLGPTGQGAKRLRVRVQVLLTFLILGDNIIGAVIASLFAAYVLPSPAPTPAVRTALLLLVPAYVLLAGAVGVVVGTAGTLRVSRWLRDDRDPSDAELRGTLRTPLRITLVQASLWAVATLLFTGVSVALQPERAFATAFVVAISGLVTSGFAYVLTEFAMRPVAARALSRRRADGVVGLGIRYRQLVFWLLGTGAPVVGLMTAAVFVLVQRDATVDQLAVVILVLGAIVLVFGCALTVINARALVGPIVAVREALEEVERGQMDTEVVVYDGTELGRMQSGFNEMVAGLRERERLRDVFGRHVGRDVAAVALDDVELGGEAREVSVLFVDLVGSTGFADEHEPAEVVEMLNRFFTVVVEEVDRHHGLVNKFIGDAVLAVFGAPNELADHATCALAAARAMSARLAREVPQIGAGVGVATGEAVAGNVGDASRFEYTVIGDAVNSAARITDLAKDVDGALLAAWDSVAAAHPDEAAHWQRYGTERLRGRSSDTELGVPSSEPT